MTSLALDTTHLTGSLYLRTSRGSEFTSWDSDKSHSEIVFEKITEVLRNQNLELSGLKSLIVNHGPGSFTGIRISVNLLKTLSYSLNIPVYAYNTLDILAHSAAQENLIIAVNAHSNLCYFKNYLQPEDEIKVLNIQSLQNELEKSKGYLAGDFFSLMQGQLSFSRDKLLTSCVKSDAQMLFSLHEFKQSEPLNWRELNPFYVRKSAPEEKIKF
jgi:tRNA threonylcarbamoyl adenosine modification protein YeaZ